MTFEIRPLARADLPEADRIFRLAFGTFLGLPDPLAFMGDADLVGTRWRADPAATLGAYIGNTLIGSNFAANWGSFGFFGPLTVHPDLWDKGVARRLLSATMTLFEQWGTRQAALFTFPDSPKHIGFYRKFGFQPRALTPVLSKPVGRGTGDETCSRYSGLTASDRAACLTACRKLTDAIYPGLDLGREIEAVARLQLGDSILLHDGSDLVGFAVCHLGSGSEAGAGTAFVKFGAVRPGAGAARTFQRLLSACEALAAASGCETLVAGVNSDRTEAHRAMLGRGFAPLLEGIAMHRPDDPGYNRPDCFVIDDWR